jgi:ABC-type polysaccharide/polyol phosphate export permease
MAAIFTTVVVAIFAMLGTGREPVLWVYYIPLFPLALLLLSGIYMFVLPYAVRWRKEGQAS